ncbi:sedoheptulokinase-like isoform X2 [Gordionus sp. m RMFG-2023]
MFLGIDIGTTNIKINVLSSSSTTVIYAKSYQYVNYFLSPNKYEKNPRSIIDGIHQCMISIPKNLICDISSISLCCQMHGVILWKNDINNIDILSTDINNYCSFLYTWEDQRSESILKYIPTPFSQTKVFSGYGCATLFWLQTQKLELQSYEQSGTIGDFIVFYLCKLSKSIISYHNAMSWGYFDAISKNWNIDILNKTNFPIKLLPDIQDPSYIAGYLTTHFYDIKIGIPIYITLGDLQCSIYANFTHNNKAVFNMGTSTQIALTMPSDFIPPYIHERHNIKDLIPPIEFVPFFDSRYLAIAASLNGGNIISLFIEMLQNWLSFFGSNITSNVIWESLERVNAEDTTSVYDNLLDINPIIFGERHDSADMTSFITKITSSNIKIDLVYTALCKGLVQNIIRMMPKKFLISNGITGLIG